MSKPNQKLRAIPREVAFFNLRKAMRVYIYLLLNSSLLEGSEGLRIAQKNIYNTSISSIGKALKMDNKTVRSHLNKLEESGYIIIGEKEYMVVKPKQYQLVHVSVLELLIVEECPYTVVVYSELLNKFSYFTVQNNKETVHTQSQLFRELSGKNQVSGSIVDKIGKVILKLAELGLLSYKQRFIEETGNTIMLFTNVVDRVEIKIDSSDF